MKALQILYTTLGNDDTSKKALTLSPRHIPRMLGINNYELNLNLQVVPTSACFTLYLPIPFGRAFWQNLKAGIPMGAP